MAAKAKVTYIALMRGINVGGKNKLPMKELAALFEEAGCEDVRTYIQSGNVVFKASAKLAEKLAVTIHKQIEARFKLSVPVVTRSAEELAAAAKNNPFLKNGADEDEVALMFLADEPAAAAVKALDPHRSPPDEYVVKGRDIYLRLPNGFAETKLTNAYFDSKLKTVSTARNWRTVLKLLELAGT